MYIIYLLETQRGWTVDEEVRCGIGVEELSVHIMNVKLHVRTVCSCNVCMYTGLHVVPICNMT